MLLGRFQASGLKHKLQPQSMYSVQTATELCNKGWSLYVPTFLKTAQYILSTYRVQVHTEYILGSYSVHTKLGKSTYSVHVSMKKQILYVLSMYCFIFSKLVRTDLY